MKLERKPKLARIAAIPNTFGHILGQLRLLIENGFQLDLISSDGDFMEVVSEKVPCRHIVIEIRREINLIRDLRALIEIYRTLKRNGYDIVHSSTPKAGFLTAIAAFLARVPVRMHTFTGQRWISTKGLLKLVLRFCDRVIGWLSTRVYADSTSQAQFLIEEGIIGSHSIKVIHKGCLGGIDFDKFSEGSYSREIVEIERELNLNHRSLKLIFVGRINKDKGIVELVEAFCELIDSGEDIDLIMLGHFEPHLDPIPQRTIELIENHSRIYYVGFTPTPQHYFAVANLFCLPSYREGFGTVVMEAAAMGLPAVGTRIPGLVDAIVDRETGILVNVKDVKDLKRGIKEFIDDPDLTEKMGRKAKQRAQKDFEYSVIAEKLIQEYVNELSPK